MNSINTQLAHFALEKGAEALLVNITWFGLDLMGSAMRGLTDKETQVFIGFIKEHCRNFPGPYFIAEDIKDVFELRPSRESGKAAAPHYLLLPRRGFAGFPLPAAGFACIRLLDAETGAPLAYGLDFDMAGRIEIYRKL